MIPGGGGQANVISPSPLSSDKLVDLLALALEREEQRPVLAEREARLLGLGEVWTVRVTIVALISVLLKLLALSSKWSQLTTDSCIPLVIRISPLFSSHLFLCASFYHSTRST